jgi:hypothetical protein
MILTHEKLEGFLLDRIQHELILTGKRITDLSPGFKGKLPCLRLRLLAGGKNKDQQHY